MKTYLFSIPGERHEDRIPLDILTSNEDDYLKEFVKRSEGEEVTDIAVEETDYDIQAKLLYTENGMYFVEEIGNDFPQ